MFNNRSEEDWQPADGLELEDAAAEAVRSPNNTLVIAGPGAGKTELLAQRACFLLETNKCMYPYRILAISFKKDAAENLANRVKKRCGKELASRFDSLTYDAFAKGIVDRFHDGIPRLYRPERNYQIATVSNVRQVFNILRYVSRNENSRINETLHKSLVSSKLLYDNFEDNQKAQNVWQILLRGYEDEIQPALSFQMISRLAELTIRTNPLIQKAIQTTYSFVFLDEFQDTTEIQYELVKTCFLNSKSVLSAVGDNKQRIMLWAGALRNVFGEYMSDFNAEPLKLIMNYRSAPRLVEIQKLIQTMLGEVNSQIKTSSKWEPQDGKATLYLFEDYYNEAESIADEIVDLIDRGYQTSDISILVRQLPDIYGCEIIKQLAQRGIKARNENEFQDFLAEPGIILILEIISLSISRTNPEAWIKILDIIYILRGINEFTAIDKVFESQNSLSQMLNTVKANFQLIEKQEDLSDIIEIVFSFLNRDSLRSLYPQYKEGSYFDDLIHRLKDYLWCEYQETNDWSNAIDNLKGQNTIPIMTIHKSKGLEYEAVFFVGLEDSAFWNYVRNPEEDNCTFFVALSRAKSHLYFTFSHHRPTRFQDIQTNDNIGPFYDVLRESGLVEEICYLEE